MKPATQSILCVVLTTLFIGTTSSRAAEADQPNQPPRRVAKPPPAEPQRQRIVQGQPGQPMGGGAPIESILTPEQRGQFLSEMQAQREKLRELNEKAQKLRREIDEAMYAEKLDEPLVRKKTTELAEVETERSLIRARAFAKVRPSMDDGQLERLKRMREAGARGPGPGVGPGGFRPGQPPPRGPEGNAQPDDVLPPPAPQRPPSQ